MTSLVDPSLAQRKASDMGDAPDLICGLPALRASAVVERARRALEGRQPEANYGRVAMYATSASSSARVMMPPLARARDRARGAHGALAGA